MSKNGYTHLKGAPAEKVNYMILFNILGENITNVFYKLNFRDYCTSVVELTRLYLAGVRTSNEEIWTTPREDKPTRL